MLLGSPNPTSREQVNYLKTAQPEVPVFTAPGPATLKNLTPGKVASFLAEQVAAWPEPAVVVSSSEVELGEGDTGAAAGLFRSFFAELAHPCLQRTAITTLILSRGDIAWAVLERLGAEGVKIIAEPVPDIPLGWVLGGKHKGLALITKAGGFGSRTSLSNHTRVYGRFLHGKGVESAGEGALAGL